LSSVSDVKISSGTVSTFRVPTDEPFESDGTAVWDSTTMVLVELTAGDTTALGYSYADGAASAVAQTLLQKHVVGCDPFDIASIHTALDCEVRNMGRPGIASCAIAAIDICLWDLKAKLLKVSLLDLLGSVRDEIAAYGSGGFTSYSEHQLIGQLSGWAEKGLRAVKMKIGREPERDVARVQATQKALGGRAKLYVDANGAYSRKQALSKAEQFGDLGVVWFEEPVSSDDQEGLKLLVDRAPAVIDIAAGEYIYVLDDARYLVESRAVDVLQADVTRCGGITNFLKIAALCETFHLPLSAHTAPSVHSHLCCAAVPACNVEYFHDHERIEHLFFDGATTPKDGYLRPDRMRSGLGLELKPNDVAQYQTFRSTV
jgi:L-alanine-DL-glutamate epimerase-like enolase superfamily enzyme